MLRDEIITAACDRWRARGEQLGMTFFVPACPLTEAECEALVHRGGALAYLPPELAGASARALLARLFPAMRSYACLPENDFRNGRDHAGWFEYETAVDAPRLDTDEDGLLIRLAAEGRRLLTLNEYVVASQDQRQDIGRYLDERATWTRLDTRLDGRLIAARFDGSTMAEGLGDEEPAEGSLLVAYDVSAGDHVRVLGGRTTAVRDQPRSTVPTQPLAQMALLQPLPRTPRPGGAGGWWHANVDAFTDFGFHEELGLNAEDYRASLPRPTVQPVSYRGRFDLPVLVETRIEWRRQAELAGIRLSHGVRTSEIVPMAGSTGPGDGPYLAWCSAWDTRFPAPVSPSQARESLAGDEAGGTIEELVSLEIAYPELSRSGKFSEAIGSGMQGLVDAVPVAGATAQRFPCLYHWRGQPELGANLHPEPFSIFRPLVRGRHITRQRVTTEEIPCSETTSISS